MAGDMLKSFKDVFRMFARHRLSLETLWQGGSFGENACFPNGTNL